MSKYVPPKTKEEEESGDSIVSQGKSIGVVYYIYQ
jgi:hypothetical protein